MGIHTTRCSEAILVANHGSYKLNEPQVTGERLDGEYILLHFETGCYFSVVGTSADVCQRLFAGIPTSSIVDELVKNYDLDPDTTRKEVETFVAQLEAEGLITAIAEEPAGKPSIDGLANSFTPLGIEKFDDMAEQLLLDPIHEIDERGWPQPKPA